MTKVFIVEVDLGVTIDDLIGNDVAELSKEAQEELNNAINLAKKVKELKEKKEAELNESQTKIDQTMESIYDKLIAAGADGVPIDNIAKLIEGSIPTMSAFTMRMKKILRDKGNPYILERKKEYGVPRYYFGAFNEGRL